MGNKNSPKTPDSNWMKTAELLQSGTDFTDSIALADKLFEVYLNYPESSQYKPRGPEDGKGKQSGAFTHDFDPTQRAIRLHFVERNRGPKSEFGMANMLDRRADMQAMMMLIRKNGYEPAPSIVTSGSWMYNIRSIINVMPVTFRESAGSPPHLSLNGDSYWGQLVTSDGGCNMRRSDEFREKLKVATNLDEMVAAMPYPVLFLHAPIVDFYDYYGMK